MNLKNVYRCAFLQLKANKEIDLFGQSSEATTSEMLTLVDILTSEEGTAFVLLVQQYQEYEAAYLNWLSALGRRHNAYTPKEYQAAQAEIYLYSGTMNKLIVPLRTASLMD